MSVPAPLVNAVGEWAGTYDLWLDPPNPPIRVESGAVVEQAIGDRFLSVRYQWEYDGKPCVGALVVGDDPGAKECAAFWADTFHNGHRMMPCRGAIVASGAVRLLGSYPAPTGPDWGWRSELELIGADVFVMRAYNITPDGAEELAVEATYHRRR